MTQTVPATDASATLYFGPWYRKSPFFESTLEAGCSAYDIYNHMYLPGYYDDPVKEYWALLNNVTIWDVGVERVVEISGPDGFELTNMITCRDLTKCAVGQGKYVLITAPDGGIVNDPVLLRRDENTFWLCLADGDTHLYAMGLAEGKGLNATVTLPEVYPVQVQGKKSKDVMAKLVGPEILDERGFVLDVCFVHAQLLGDNLLDALFDVLHELLLARLLDARRMARWHRLFELTAFRVSESDGLARPKDEPESLSEHTCCAACARHAFTPCACPR